MLKSLFNKVTSLHSCNFIKKRLQQRCFRVNIAKFLRKPILKNICGRLLLFSEIQTINNVMYTIVKNFNFNFRIHKIFTYLLSFTNFSSTEFVFVFASLSHTKHFYCFILQWPKQIKVFQSLSKISTHLQYAEPDFSLYLAKLSSRDKPQHH